MEKLSTRFGTVRTQVLCVTILCIVSSTFSGLAVRAAGAKAESAPCDSETTGAGMRNCENLRYQGAEHALNLVYADLLKQLDTAGKNRLRSAQAAWLKFRQAEADFEADIARDGTLAPLIRTTVMADLTEARTAELKKSLQP
jgi:uncharacterized protein YecT (DUF1311 family)